jgi:hypothetical protein
VKGTATGFRVRRPAVTPIWLYAIDSAGAAAHKASATGLGSAVPTGCVWPSLITVPELAAKALGSFLAKEMSGRFGSTHADLTELIPSAARLALECLYAPPVTPDGVCVTRPH